MSELKKWKVLVYCTTYTSKEFIVEANEAHDAQEMAIEKATNVNWKNYSSNVEYEIDSCEQVTP